MGNVTSASALRTRIAPLFPLASAAPQGKTLYDALYSVGYHNNTGYHHSGQLIKVLNRFKHNRSIHTVLDLGCSHGAAVETLWKNGFKANGVDVSELAVEKARKHRSTKINRCSHNGPCF